MPPRTQVVPKEAGCRLKLKQALPGMLPGCLLVACPATRDADRGREPPPPPQSMRRRLPTTTGVVLRTAIFGLLLCGWGGHFLFRGLLSTAKWYRFRGSSMKAAAPSSGIAVVRQPTPLIDATPSSPSTAVPRITGSSHPRPPAPLPRLGRWVVAGPRSPCPFCWRLVCGR